MANQHTENINDEGSYPYRTCTCGVPWPCQYAGATYAERQLAHFEARVTRFIGIRDLQPPRPLLLAKEGGLLIEAICGVAGPQSLAEYAQLMIERGKELDQLCSADHADDPSLHPIVDSGLCAECVKEIGADGWPDAGAANA